MSSSMFNQTCPTPKDISANWYHTKLGFHHPPIHTKYDSITAGKKKKKKKHDDDFSCFFKCRRQIASLLLLPSMYVCRYD